VGGKAVVEKIGEIIPSLTFTGGMGLQMPFPSNSHFAVPVLPQYLHHRLTRNSSTSHYFLAMNSVDSLPSKEGFAVNLVAQLETMLSPEPSVMLFR